LNNNVFTNHIEALITKNVIESERIEFKLDSPKPMFETNSDNIYFLSILPIHLQFKTDDNNSRPESRLELRPESELAIKVIKLLVGNDLSKSELARKLEHKTISGELNKQIKWLLDHGFIERIIPENPSSRIQKYRLITLSVELSNAL